MRDFLTLGSTPTNEPCAQVGTDDYATKSRIESRVFIDQLLRQFGEPPGLSTFRRKSFPHDFGTYHEVVIAFDDENEEAVAFAYDVENNLPEQWDEQALKELRGTDYHMSVVRRMPSADAPGLVAMEPAVVYGVLAKAS